MLKILGFYPYPGNDPINYKNPVLDTDLQKYISNFFFFKNTDTSASSASLNPETQPSFAAHATAINETHPLNHLNPETQPPSSAFFFFFFSDVDRGDPHRTQQTLATLTARRGRRRRR